MIKIGQTSLRTARPADLDTALIAVSGCNAEEVRRQLGGNPLAGHIARALHPFLDDKAPAVSDLADMIAAGDIHQVAADVAALLAPHEAKVTND